MSSLRAQTGRWLMILAVFLAVLPAVHVHIGLSNLHAGSVSTSEPEHHDDHDEETCPITTLKGGTELVASSVVVSDIVGTAAFVGTPGFYFVAAEDFTQSSPRAPPIA